MKYYPQINNFNERYQQTDLAMYECEHRRINIYQDIDSKVAETVSILIRKLSEDSKEPIYIYINSAGGSVHDGMAILDAMEVCGCEIVTIATGKACSMASVILASGTKGKRYATRNCEIMIHQPLTTGIKGQSTDITIAATHLDRLKTKLAKIVSSNSNKTLKRVISDMERDYWMDATEAKEYGLIDEIGIPETI